MRARPSWIALLSLALAAPGVPCPELADDAVAWILEHTWPGNVRELKNALAHALVMAGGGPEVRRACFPRVLLAEVTAEAPREAGPRTREEILRSAVEDALRDSHGNLSEAARRLGVARSTLYRMMPKRG